jgi:alpha-amylase
MQNWLWLRTDGVGKYYNMKFDGWRFDYVKGFGPWVVKDWNTNVGGFSVGEYWDANVNTWNGGQTMPTALYLTLPVTTKCI